MKIRCLRRGRNTLRMSFVQWQAKNVEETSLPTFMRVHVCTANVHACACSFHMYMSVFLNSYARMPQHVHGCINPAYVYMRPGCACGHLKTHFFLSNLIISYSFPTFLIQIWSHALLSSFYRPCPLLQVEVALVDMSSWYRTLIDDTKALVCTASFESIICLIHESSYGILVQKLIERWWDTTHPFHIVDQEMTVTPHDFHQMTNLRFDESFINLEGESSIQLGVDLLERRYSSKSIHQFDIEENYMPISQETLEDCTQMTRAFVLYLLGAYLFRQWRTDCVFKVAGSLPCLWEGSGGELGLGLSCLPVLFFGHTWSGDSMLAGGTLEAP